MKLQKETKKIIALTTKEVIFSLMDLPLRAYSNFEYPRMKSLALQKFVAERDQDRIKFLATINYLLRKRIIRKFIKNKKEYIELTEKFRKGANSYFIRHLEIKKKRRWDGKWRIVIFDIPEKRKKMREILRSLLKRLKFKMVQESVFVHPLDSRQEIKYLVDHFRLKGSVKYLIAEIIEGEEKIISHFLKEGILRKNDLK